MAEQQCDIVAPASRAISGFTTAELLDELAVREGVMLSYAAEGASMSVSADGPATIVVFDGRDSPVEGE